MNPDVIHALADAHRSYHRSFVTRGYWLVVTAVVALIAAAVLHHATVAAAVCMVLCALSVAVLFVLLGGDLALFGLCVFNRRYRQSLASAAFGLALCLLGAAFLVFSGVAGFVMALR